MNSNTHYPLALYLGQRVSFCALFALSALLAQKFVTAQSVSVTLSAPTISSVGPHHRVWQSIGENILPDGTVLPHTNQFTEIQTGLYYDDGNGQWLESQELFTTHPSGAVAQFGQVKVILANNINTADAVDVLSPDGKRFRSHLLGLSYFDLATGNSVLLAEVTNSVGELLPPNQVIYRNAGDGMRFDVRYTYEKGAFHQDVILVEQPPSPSEFGLNPETTELEILTEFIEAPPLVNASPDGNQTSDDEISFGAMQFGFGRAFLLNSPTTPEAPVSKKQWRKLEGRQFLIEKVAYSAVTPLLQNLPPEGQIARAQNLKRHLVAGRQLPPPRVSAGQRGPMALASLGLPSKGVVLDYTQIVTSSDYTFKSTETYYVAGAVNLSGRTTFEGGTVIKFATGTTPQITIVDSIDCQSGPYRPVICTAKDDNSVGETMPGSTGSPSGYYGSGIALSKPGNRLDNFRFSYLNWAITYNPSIGSLDVANVQFVKCDKPLKLANTTTMNVFNALFYTNQTLTYFNSSGGTVRGQHWTVDIAGTFAYSVSGTVSIYLTNSIVAALSAWGYTPTLVATTTNASGSGLFQTVGAGAHYLAANSADRNAGSVGLTTAQLRELATKTTYPPLSHNDNFSIDEVLGPQAQRDDDVPDRGYHYDPLDWVVANRTVSATLILTNGVALAHRDTYGLRVDTASKLISEGTPQSLNRIVRYNSVQEQADSTWAQSGWWGGIVPQRSAAGAIPEVRLRFTEVPGWAGDNHVFLANTPVLLNANDTQFRAAKTWVDPSNVSSNISLNFTNCLFDRVVQHISASSGYDPIIATYRNCLFYYGDLWMANNGSQSGSWYIGDSLFDTVAVTQNGYNVGNSYNGYISTSALTPAGTGNVTGLTSANYQTGPLGRFYLPNTSLLLKSGSRRAELGGMYHYTTSTDQSKQATNVVDIGFHYVSLDSPSVDLMGVDKSLVLYLKADEGSSSSLGDSSSYGFNATLSGGYTWPTGRRGKAIGFDGSSGKAVGADAADLRLTGDMSIALWVYKTGTPGNWNQLVGKNNNLSGSSAKVNYGFYLEPGSGKRLNFQQLNGPAGTEFDLLTKTTLELNTWYHIVATIRGSLGSIYVNGNLDNTEVVGSVPVTTTDPVNVAYDNVHGYFQGYLDDIRIYNRALSAGEASSLYAQRGLAAQWKLEETSGPSADSSGNGHSGTWSGGVSSTTGPVGKALAFDGSGSITATETAALRLPGDLTVACWMQKTSEPGGWVRLVGKGSGSNRNYGLWLEPSMKRLKFQRYDTLGGNIDLVSVTATALNTWYHVAATMQTGIASIYVNGQLEASMAAPNTGVTNSEQVTLASLSGFTPLVGALDDVRIYDHALSATEIQALANQRGLVAYWNLDEGYGTQTADATELGHTGTITGGYGWVDGVSGRALKFDGSTQVSATSTTDLQLANDLTIALWVRKTVNLGAGEWSRIIGKGSNDLNYGIYALPGSDQRFEFQQYTAGSFFRGVTSQTQLELGRWYHVAAIVRNNTAYLYVNGKLDGLPSTVVATGPTTTQAVTLGYNNIHSYFQGELDDVRLYNRALSLPEIRRLIAARARDSDGDGFPDYWEDGNGNGSLNSGETDWTSATDGGLKVNISVPKANSNIP